MPETIGVPEGFIEEWSISKAVGPGRGAAADIMLVQSMLKIFLTAPDVIDSLPASDRDVIDKIFTSTLRSGSKFADGVYGANTRAAVGILERKIGSPVKDGVLRPLFERDPMGRSGVARGTKMRELNEFWDEIAIASNGGSKKESGRALLSPGLFSLLYKKG